MAKQVESEALLRVTVLMMMPQSDPACTTMAMIVCTYKYQDADGVCLLPVCTYTHGICMVIFEKHFSKFGAAMTTSL